MSKVAFKVQATLKMNEGKYEEACRLFEKSLQHENPQDFDCNKWLGVCLRMLGRFEDSLKSFDRAIRKKTIIFLLHYFAKNKKKT